MKRVERGNPYEWMEQAERDAGTKIPVVAHKRNGKDWICIMSAESLFALIRETNQPLIIREIQSSNSQSASGVADATP